MMRSRSYYQLGLLLLVLLLTACLSARTAAPLTRQIVTSDGEMRQIQEQPLAGKPDIDSATARQRAGAYVPGAAQATTVETRFAALTLASDRQAWNFKARPVWLVTYVGLPFMPEACACHVPPMANTVVALDAHDGAFLLIYGSEGDDAQSPGR